jgi:hypothetical protein
VVVVADGVEEPLLGKVEETEAGIRTIDKSVALQRTSSEDGTWDCNCLPTVPKITLYDVFRDHHISRGLLHAKTDLLM